MESTTTLEKIVALCKRRGFVYQSAELYGGLNGVYDFGPLGTLLKHNIKQAWLTALRTSEHHIVLLDGAILGPQAVWKASGHVDNFNDPMVDCLTCKKRYRADDGSVDLTKACPACGKKTWTDVRQFNMMFKTQLGAAAQEAAHVYLRPETAQAVFVNFKNVMATTRVKIPFGIAQIGKAFRNEITPKQFLFRMREFEQMELEWFCAAENALNDFDTWCQQRRDFYTRIGITPSKIRLRPHARDELAHYSTQCSDVEYEFPFGWKELEGIAHRGTFDLTQHAAHAHKDLAVNDLVTQQSYIPTIIECSVGVERLFLTVLFDAYCEDVIEGEPRTVLRLAPALAPIKAALLPLSKKLNEPMEKIAHTLRMRGHSVEFDDSGSIGKRYRRQDEIGTPYCFTYDFMSLEDHQVTVRHRDSTQQERIALDALERFIIDHCGLSK